MTIPFLKNKKLRGVMGALVASIIVWIVFLVLPAIAGSPTAQVSTGSATVGGGASIQQGYYMSPS